MNQKAAVLAALVVLLAGPAGAQYVYPAKGQSPQQQKTDEGACHTWAVQQTGFDPAKPPPPAQAGNTPTGTTAGAGARGAARGAVAAEIVGGDAGKGAAVGAVAHRSRSRRANAAAAEAAPQQQTAEYNRARAACLEGKGYTVK